MAASRLCQRAALVALCVARVSGAFPAGHATCCSEEKKCCGQTFPPPKSHACAEGHRCCVGDCDAVSLETVVARPARVQFTGAGAGASAAAQVPPPVSRARNAYGLRISVRAPASAKPPPKSSRETAAESAKPPPAPRRTAATSSTPTAGSAARTTATTARPRDARRPRRRDARRARDAAPPAGCRAFTSDCGTCDTYCSRLDDA